MDRKTAEKGQGARKAIAAVQPAPADDAAKPAAASKGRGRRQEPPSECPGKAKTSLVNQGKGPGHSGKESAPGGRKTSLENSTPGAEKCDRPARKSDKPSEDKGALQKQERHLQAKAFEPEKADVASGAVPREKNRLPREEEPDGEKKEAPRRGKKASQKAKEPPEQGRAEVVPRGPPPPQSISLRQVLERLRLRKLEISDASRRVNSIRNHLVEAIKERLYLSSVETLGTGSYYEHLKIMQPDEFDIMLKVPGVRVELEPYNDDDCKGIYYFVKLKRNPGLQRLNDFVDDQDHLSASKILSELRSIIINEVKTINAQQCQLNMSHKPTPCIKSECGMKVTVERKKPGSPAVTLRIGEPPSHVSVDIILALEMLSKTLGSIRKGGPDIKKWLGVKQQNELDKMNLCLVPKNAKNGAHFVDTWRLSFSLAEKTIIQYHGKTKTCCEGDGSKCCRKDCLKLLKYLLEQLKTKHQNRNQFSKFCSYHAKTAFFHVCTKWTNDEEWLPVNLEECFGRLLDFFLDCLRKAELKHFFIPECNLFCTNLKCKILKNVIESERTAKFPVFQQT